MQLHWLDAEQPSSREVAGAVAVLEAARAVDCPTQIGPTTTTFLADLRHGWDGDPFTTAVATGPDGPVSGVLQLQLPTWDNTHLGFLLVTVDPIRRGRGIGRRLFETAVDRIRGAGRRLVVTDTMDQPAGTAFAKAMGLDRVSEGALRRQDIRAVDVPALERDFAAAREHASGYELIRLAGTTPDEMLADVAEMTAAINDAPTDDLDVEDEVFTPERVRAFEGAQTAAGRRLYRVAARETSTGALVGHTVVCTEPERPWFGWQYDTSVARAHRGHRLGLLLKIEMLRWLREEEPQLRTLDTGNAASNAHMIRVNEQLGYHVTGTMTGWQRHL